MDAGGLPPRVVSDSRGELITDFESLDGNSDGAVTQEEFLRAGIAQGTGHREAHDEGEEVEGKRGLSCRQVCRGAVEEL